MMSSLLMIVYLCALTFFFLLVLVIGYFIDKSYKLASISPAGTQNKVQAETTFAINLQAASKTQSQPRTQQVTRIENNELDDFFNQGDNSPNINLEEQLYSNERNITENHSPVRLSVDPKQVSSPRTNRSSVKRQGTLRKTILMRKPTIGLYEGMDTGQTTNRKSLKSTGQRASQMNSERGSVSDFNALGNQNKQNQQRMSQFSLFSKIDQKLDPNYKIPKPENNYYKCHQFSKIFYSHKEGISRIFMILTIYFRQLICLDACGIVLTFLPDLNQWITIGITCGTCLFFKIVDYYMIKAIVHHQHTQFFRYLSFFLWIISLGGAGALITLFSLNNLQWLLLYLPSLLLDLIVVDPLKFLMIKYCLQEAKKIREPDNKVDVFKVMQQIK